MAERGSWIMYYIISHPALRWTGNVKGGVILYCIILYINPGILFEDWSGGLCRCRRHLFLRHLFLQSLPHTLFSPRQHGTVQARASTATARLARPRIMIRTSRPGPGGPAGRPNPPPVPWARLRAPGAGAGTGLPRRTMPGLLGRLL